MNYCTNCGTTLREDQQICPICGLDCAAHPKADSKETAAINLMYRLMKYERLAWYLGGGFQLACAALLIFLLLVLSAFPEVTAQLNLSSTDIPMWRIYAVFYSVSGIVSMVFGGKITRCMDVIFCDIRPAYDRTTAVSTIVLAALFNNVALVFAIINFATAKGNRATIGQIIHNQLHHRGGNGN